MAQPLESIHADSVELTRPNAFVTLLTAPSYLPGALALLHALHELHPAPRAFKIACLVTPETVDARTIGALRNAGYDVVVGVEPIASGTRGHSGLQLMGRPDLDLALTKLHIFRLGPMFDTVIYMDADTLPIRPLSHLFETTAPHILSACPDIGWPDCFNSGVMVIRPRLSDFENLRRLMVTDASGGNGSFDGADQGLLNHYFSEEGAGGPWNRLPFTYNVTPSAAYQYMPAFQRYAHKISVIHFIGPRKPWGRMSSRPAGLGISRDNSAPMSYERLIDRWFDVYDRNVRPIASHEPNIAKRFTVPENIAVWNRPHDHQTSEERAQPAAPLGPYTSLPLDGRVDLMMPQPELPQPRPSPQAGPGHHQAHGGQGDPTHHHRASISQSHTSHEAHHARPRSPSPPPEPQMEAAWDGSRAPPPKDSKPEMAQSVMNVYIAAWDEPAHTQGTYHHQHHDAFALPTLPTNVLKNDWYGQFTNTVPDPEKVARVFPWESSHRQRNQPSRVFPKERPPPPPPAPALAPVTAPAAAPTSTPTPKTADIPPPIQTPGKQTEPTTAHMSFSESMAMAQYANAWDTDASIGRYAERLTSLGIVKGRRQASGMYTVPPTPRRASSWKGEAADKNGASTPSPTSSVSSGRRASYEDKGTQTERPMQKSAKVQASPETSPMSESPPKARSRLLGKSTSPHAQVSPTPHTKAKIRPPPLTLSTTKSGMATSTDRPITSTKPTSRQSPTNKPAATARASKPTPRGRVWDPQTDIDVIRRHQIVTRSTTS